MSRYGFFLICIMISWCAYAKKGERPKLKEKPNPAGIEWVRIEGGTFRMGSLDGLADESPIHEVTVKSFEIGKTEVTFGQWKKCVDAKVCTPPHVSDGLCYFRVHREGEEDEWHQGVLPQSFQTDDRPVVCIDFEQANVFAKWAGGRLPTEAEWEYAARGGGKERKYPWGNEEPTCERAIMKNGCGRNSTMPVCSKILGNTPQGLCDMAGNVWEWCSDRYGLYKEGAVVDPKGAETGWARVNRGGGWNSIPLFLRVTARDRAAPTFAYDALGLRVVRDVDLR